MARRLPHGSRLLALVALLAAGCGGAGTTPAGSGPDPATVTPADAAVFFQATVRPSGAQRAGVLAAARKVTLMQDPGAALRRLLDRSLGSSNGVSYSRDVEPWLGQRIGGFVRFDGPDPRHPDYAIAAAIADRGAFDAALPRLRKAGHERAAGSYRGVAYAHDPSDRTYDAPVGDFYVGGTLAGLRAAIDAHAGSSLAGAGSFKDAAGRVPGDALAFVYADPSTLLAALGRGRSVPPAARRALAAVAAAGPVVASLTASADQIALDASGGLPAGAAASGSSAQVSAGQLPGDAWLAVATPPLGPLVKAALQSAGVHDMAAAQVRARLGLDLDRDLLNPLGGLAVFARGESVLDLGGGVLLQMTSAAAAQLLATRLEAIAAAGLHVAPQPLTLAGAHGFQLAVPQVPQPIVVLAKDSRLAVGYAASSAQDLLAPRQRFDASPAGKAALATLGDGYAASFVLVVPPFAALLRSLAELQVARLSPVLPYLAAYRSLAIGTKRDGGRISVRIVAALR